MERASLVAVALAAAAASFAPAARGADPKAECIAAADRGQSQRDEGHYLRARDSFAVCLRDACPKIVAQSCTRWMRELEDAMPTVTLAAKDEGGQDLTAAHVTIDGAPLTEVLDGKPLAVDPGPHVLRFEKAGSEPAEEHVVLGAGEKNRVVAVTLHAAGAQASAGADTQEPAAEAPAQGGTGTTKKVVTLSMLVLGAAGIGAGAVLLVQAGKQSSSAAGLRTGISSNACTDDPSSPTCQQLGSAVDAQHRDAAIGATALVAGGLLAAGAVVTWLVWPRSETAAASVRWIGPGGIAGTF
ncbi:MAG TPA: hypothetical protein VGG39_12355 [Polyangiaceae bacterium]|jgi:hypothetical protein